METKALEKRWYAAMSVAVAMKKEGLDTGSAIKKLRDARVLVNHCIHDEHAHSDEFLEAEMAVEEAQGTLISLLKAAGREEDFSFETRSTEKVKNRPVQAPPKNVPKNMNWVRIRITKDLALDQLSTFEGVEVIERDENTITLSGNRESIQKALSEISKGFSE